jgi:hypothetical protein
MHPCPSHTGDALILRTQHSFSVYAVGPVTADGQQDFREHQLGVHYPHDLATAQAYAEAIVVPGRRIFFLNIDTDVWSEILRTRARETVPATAADRRAPMEGMR